VKKFIFGSLAAIVILAVGATGYLGLGFAPVGADAKAPRWEVGLMNPSIHASVRRRAPKGQSLQVPTDETLIAGGKLYLDDCVGCHGEPGKPSDFGALFCPPAPQFFQVGTQYSESEIFWVAKHGIRRTGMNPQYFYSDEKLWLLAAFIKRVNNLSPSVLEGIQQQRSK
jgi:mono/diheme cytochrome c family protein